MSEGARGKAAARRGDTGTPLAAADLPAPHRSRPSKRRVASAPPAPIVSAAPRGAERGREARAGSSAAAVRYAEKNRDSTCLFADRIAQCAIEAYRRHAAAVGLEYKQTVARGRRRRLQARRRADALHDGLARWAPNSCAPS